MKKEQVIGGFNAILEKAGAKFRVALQKEAVKMSAETKTVEGVVIATPADAFAEGVEVFVIPEDGSEPIPAPDGDHTLESGEVVTVADGKVVAIMSKPEETEMSDEIKEVVQNLSDRIAVLEGQNTEATTELSAVKSENDTLKAELAKLKAENAKLSKAPAAKSVKETTELSKEKEKSNEKPKKSFKQMTYLERIEAQSSN
jgi:hypothetical protein